MEDKTLDAGSPYITSPYPAWSLIENAQYKSLTPGMMRRLNLYLIYLDKLPESEMTVTPKQMASALLLDSQLV